MMLIKVQIFKKNYFFTLLLGHGFKLDYTSSYEGCGGVLTGYKGNLYTTPYPEPYQPNMRCRWEIG